MTLARLGVSKGKLMLTVEQIIKTEKTLEIKIMTETKIKKQIEIICEKSGLKFLADNFKSKTHPEIKWYSQHSDWEYRYFCLAIIEKGKQEKWDNIDKFKSEIKKAWEKANEPEPEQELYQCHYIAKIIGSDSKYRFQRDFAKSTKEEYRKSASSKYRYYDLASLTDGIYEVNHRSAKGNNSRYYLEIINGEKTKIELERVEQLFPKIEVKKMQFIMHHYADDINENQVIDESELMELGIEEAENYDYQKPTNIEEAIFVLNDVGNVTVTPFYGSNY